MQTENTKSGKNSTPAPVTPARTMRFAREKKIGFGMDFLSVKKTDQQPTYVKIDKFIEHQNKKGETNYFLLATDLETGEVGNIHLDGGLKREFAALCPDQCDNRGLVGAEKAVGKNYEIIWLGHEPAMIDGEEQDVNVYRVYAIKA